jgi:hypothetical protein
MLAGIRLVDGLSPVKGSDQWVEDDYTVCEEKAQPSHQDETFHCGYDLGIDHAFRALHVDHLQQGNHRSP